MCDYVVKLVLPLCCNVGGDRNRQLEAVPLEEEYGVVERRLPVREPSTPPPQSSSPSSLGFTCLAGLCCMLPAAMLCMLIRASTKGFACRSGSPNVAALHYPNCSGLCFEAPVGYLSRCMDPGDVFERVSDHSAEDVELVDVDDSETDQKALIRYDSSCSEVCANMHISSAPDVWFRGDLVCAFSSSGAIEAMEKGARSEVFLSRFLTMCNPLRTVREHTS
eukprot:TRINITY_DN64929_c0_g1_i1.p1 TRINITY_DN64929_c0_g1~~TRINITY_DN64929_c0_g1_i1.p1  ORF type:complete len:221 (+),score=25.40 TRINITY_DN64929_c0_g1_i1:55-717(+)